MSDEQLGTWGRGSAAHGRTATPVYISISFKSFCEYSEQLAYMMKDAVQVSKQVKAETLLRAPPIMLTPGISNHMLRRQRHTKYINKAPTRIVKSSRLL
jgi:hypothetical protein